MESKRSLFTRNLFIRNLAPSKPNTKFKIRFESKNI